jgi:hypothetical protein
MICQGGLGRPSVGLSGPCVSSHRTRVRKASQRLVSLKAFSTEETNHRFRQSSARVPSSNQWIIAQPTSCLLRLRASKGVLSRENVNSSVVVAETRCAERRASRGSGASLIGTGRASAGKSSIERPSRSLHADPEELPHPRRQVGGGHVAGHVEQIRGKPRHDVADDDPDQEALRRDAQGCTGGDLGGEDSRDPI